MSRASAAAYFKDWTILHWIYNGTVDIYAPKLYKEDDQTIRTEFYQNYRDNIDVWYDRNYEWWEDCILYNSYGGWWYQYWKASKEDMKINTNFLVIDQDIPMRDIPKEEAEKFLWYKIE